MFFHLKLNTVIWKRLYPWRRTLLSIWIILSFVRFVVFLPLSAKMLVINMKKLPDCYVMALELPSAFFFPCIHICEYKSRGMTVKRSGIKCCRLFCFILNVFFIVEVIFLWTEGFRTIVYDTKKCTADSSVLKRRPETIFKHTLKLSVNLIISIRVIGVILLFWKLVDPLEN